MARQSKLWPVTLIAGALLAPAVVAAAPVKFTITDTSIAWGSGYGIDASEPAGTLLDVRFTTAPEPSDFSLDLDDSTTLIPSFKTFLFGNVDFQEPDGAGGITGNEVDNLGVTASFVFTNPTGVTTDVIATGTAVRGPIIDANASAPADYGLVWAPVTVDFGIDGQFRITLNSLSFTIRGDKDLSATVTLLEEPRLTTPPVGPTAAPVPEPGALVLLGLGLAGLGFSRRRRD